MIVAVAKEGKDVISHIDIEYTRLHGYVYGIPLIVEIGIKEQLAVTQEFVLGEEYEVLTRYNQVVKLILAEVDSLTQIVQDKSYTAYKFMHKESYNLKYNLYRPEESVWGVSLEKYILGSKNQLKIAIFELRKKGLYLSIDENFNVLQTHTKEYENGETQAVYNPTSIQRLDSLPNKRNYSSIEADGTLTKTEMGHDRPKYIPNITKNEIKGLNLFVGAKVLIQSEHENPHALLGEGITFKGEKFALIEKDSIFIKNSLKTIFVLGAI
ncbi:MAG: hypothetical protein GQ474_10580 [Sulfurimonas sp.]|nr:hypothetical protein [Sulfurimonas sp.]